MQLSHITAPLQPQHIEELAEELAEDEADTETTLAAATQRTRLMPSQQAKALITQKQLRPATTYTGTQVGSIYTACMMAGWVAGWLAGCV
jgi:hypothetical protein